MVQSLGEAVIEVGADTGNFTRDLDRGTRQGLNGVVTTADRDGKRAGAALGGGILASVGRFAGPLAAAFAAVNVVGFFRESITAASSLGESINALSVTYGDAASEILQLGENSAEAFGLSQLELNNFAVQFSSFAQQLAGNGRTSAQVFEEIAGRATDFASVMNLEVADAAAAFQSGLAGETEPLRQFGIDLSDVTISAFAYANGIAEAGTQLTEAQKVQARYGSLMEQTNKVQGDFANTSDGLANRQRILSANFADLQARIGQAFLPVMEQLVGFLNGAVTSAIDLFSGGLGGAGAEASQLGQTFQALGAFFAPLVAEFQRIGQTIATELAPQFQQIGQFIQSEFLPAFRALLPAIAPFVQFMVSSFGTTIQGAIQILVGVLQGLVKVITGVVNIVAGLLTGDWARVWKGAQQIVGGVVDALKGIVTGLWTVIRGRVEAINRLVPGGIGGAFRVAVNTARGFINTLISVVTFIPRQFANILSRVPGILGSIPRAIQAMGNDVRNRIGSFISLFSSIPGRIRGALGDLGNLLYGAGRNVIAGLISGITSMIGRVASSMGSVAGTIRSYLPFSPAKEGPLSGTGNPENSGRKIIEMISDGMLSAMSLPADALTPALTPLAAGSLQPLTSTPATTRTTTSGQRPNVNSPVTINQNFLGPTTSGGRLAEMNWNVRYATQARSETIGGVAR